MSQKKPQNNTHIMSGWVAYCTAQTEQTEQGVIIPQGEGLKQTHMHENT